MIHRRIHPIHNILDSLPRPEPSVRRDGGDSRSAAIKEGEEGEGEGQKHCGG